MICGGAAAVTAIAMLNSQNKEKETDKICDTSKLLLLGGTDSMEINQNEKVISLKVKRTHTYNDSFNPHAKWRFRLETEYTTETFDEAVTLILSLLNVKGIQIVPLKVDKDFVDCFLLLIKTPVTEEQNTHEFETKLDNCGAEW